MKSLSCIYGYEYATRNMDKIAPLKYKLLYHGTDSVTEAEFHLNKGLPPKGSDIDLIRHIEPPTDRLIPSAFRGAVLHPMSPIDDGTGAAEWAGVGGVVYQIMGWVGYDINATLDGAIPDGKGGFRGPLMLGEQEHAIPAEVPAAFVKRIGVVVQGRRGAEIKRWREI